MSLKEALLRNMVPPFIILFVITFLLAAQIYRLINMSERVRHADKKIAKSFESQKLLLDMETGVRAYLITSLPKFLEPYERSLPLIRPTLNELNNLMINSTFPYREIELERISRIYNKIEKLKKNIDTLIALHKPMQIKPIIIKLVNDQKIIMDSLRDEFEPMTVDIQETLVKQTTSLNKGIEYIMIVGMMGFTSILLLLWQHINKKISLISYDYDTAMREVNNAKYELTQKNNQIEIVNKELKDILNVMEDTFHSALLQGPNSSKIQEQLKIASKDLHHIITTQRV
jgi:CHASE3 domain sensor protein